MRKPLLQNAAKMRVSDTDSVVAPVGGWNARDPIGKMKKEDAVILDNWFPTAADVAIRLGSDDHATGLPTIVESLMVYSSATDEEMFAASGTAIYDVSAAGAIGAAAISGLNTAQWYHVNMTTAGGSFLYAFSGSDNPLLYDGSTWTAIDSVSTPAITGVTTSSLIFPTIWKRRLFLVEVNSMSVWYLPVDSIGGAASEINFGPLFKLGGYIVAHANYTIDGGEGMDDHYVIITSEGEVAVYKGTDPASASTFALVGVFQVGAPIGRRCFTKIAGDLAIITIDGVIPFSKALVASRSSPVIALTDKIRDAFSTASRAYRLNYGWEGLLFPAGSFILFNIPVAAGSGQQQYVMNTTTSRWCRFKGWQANCWAMFNEEIYFGGDGVVTKAWTGQNDNGNDIVADAKQAFSYFGSPGQIKLWKSARPNLQSNGTVGAVIDLNVDFTDHEPMSYPSFSTITSSAWDSAVWDSSVWGGGLNTIKDWQTVSGEGYCAAFRMKCATNSISIRWTATDYIFEKGGVI